ncbi:hypothetical protein HOY80DRAFT_1047830 [Tuber brumale]|nr:hypothetical protein HOY80DRAFT_1047830 [Tuber brumale]
MEITFFTTIRIVDNDGGKEKTLAKVIINKKVCEEGGISSISTCVALRMAAAIWTQAVHPNLPPVH